MEKKLFLAARWGLLFAGMFVTALGIASVTRAGLGTTPISTLPLTVTGITGLTFGQTTFAVNVVFVFLQWILLGKRFHYHSFLQIPLVWVFGTFIDIGMGIAAPPSSYPLSFIMSVSGNALMAVGIYAQIQSRTIVQPGEGLVIALAVVARKPFGTMKIVNDVSLVVLAAALGLAALGTVYGIREGTLVSAVLVGLFVKAADRLAKKAGLVKEQQR